MLSVVVVADLGHTESWLMLEECKGLFKASCVFMEFGLAQVTLLLNSEQGT